MGGPLSRRCAGVLLHPTSLPGPGYCGTLGEEARSFIDLIAEGGLAIWQVLPLGPTHEDGCPYQCFSAHAGNVDLIDLRWLEQRGWLTGSQARAGWCDADARRRALAIAAHVFQQQCEVEPEGAWVQRYRAFLESSAHWLEDYVRFRAIRQVRDDSAWAAWPEGLRNHEAAACELAAGQMREDLDTLRFVEFVFDCQWHELRRYACDRGIALFGDMPIYVHLESADVWANQDLFDLGPDGRPITVTGVPPDYFSAEGQLWGNPQYRWRRMHDTGFAWWLQRFATAARQFDIVRIDHFRALQAFWEIPADASSARDGHWVPAPGEQLLLAVREHFPRLSLVAENLGTISPEVEMLRHRFGLPGMRILQFAFDGNPCNPYLPQQHDERDIVYTGTHDNDTSLGWFESLAPETQRAVYAALGDPRDSMPWMLIRQAMESVARIAIVPWQDFLGLDGRHRMNTPGTLEGNWQWRYARESVPAALAGRIRELLADTGRLPSSLGRS